MTNVGGECFYVRTTLDGQGHQAIKNNFISVVPRDARLKYTYLVGIKVRPHEMVICLMVFLMAVSNAVKVREVTIEVHVVAIPATDHIVADTLFRVYNKAA